MCISYLLRREGRYSPTTPVVPNGSPDDHHINPVWFLLYILLYLLGAIIYALIDGTYGNLLFCPLVFTTAFVVYTFYHRGIRLGKLNPRLIHETDLFRAFSHSFFGGGFLALILEMLISIPTILLLANTSRLRAAFEKEDFAHYKNNYRVHLYLLFTAFFIAGCVEEYTKAFLLQYVCKLYLPHPNFLHRRYLDTFVWFGICIGLGFGTAEGIVYVCIFGGSRRIWVQFIIWLIRALIAIPFHTITGFMWGINLGRRECNGESMNWISMGLYQVLFHGCYDFIELEYALYTVTTNEALNFGFVFLGCFIAFVIAVMCGCFAYFYMYRNAKNETAELIADEYHDHDNV